MKRAAVYLRVSSAPQLERFGPAVQRETVRAYAARSGLELAETYEDAITGKVARREALDRLLTHAPRYDAVVISGVDRLARRVPVSYGVLAELVDTGLEVHSADMGVIDLEDESSNIQFGVRTLFADADHWRITRRMHEARIRKVAAGTPERPLNGYGWREGVEDERESYWLRWMYERAASVGWHSIAEELNTLGVRTRAGRLWSPRMVGSLLTNPVYRGEYQFGRSRGKVRAVCEVPALVTPPVWARANETRTTRTRSSRLDTFPLTGRLVCGDCGSAVSGTTMKGGKYAYYVCHTVFIPRSIRRPCANTRRVPAHALHDALLAHLSGLLDHPEALASALHAPTVRPLDTQAMQADMTRRLARLDAAYDAGAFPADEYAQKRRALLAEREALSALPAPQLAPPPDVTQVREALRAALTLPHLAETVARLNLRATLGEGGRLHVRLDP